LSVWFAAKVNCKEALFADQSIFKEIAASWQRSLNKMYGAKSLFTGTK